MTFMETLLLIKMIEIEGGSGEGQSNKKNSAASSFSENGQKVPTPLYLI